MLLTNIGDLSEGYVPSVAELEDVMWQTESSESSHQLLVDRGATCTAHLRTHTGQEAQGLTEGKTVLIIRMHVQCIW